MACLFLCALFTTYFSTPLSSPALIATCNHSLQFWKVRKPPRCKIADMLLFHFHNSQGNRGMEARHPGTIWQILVLSQSPFLASFHCTNSIYLHITRQIQTKHGEKYIRKFYHFFWNKDISVIP